MNIRVREFIHEGDGDYDMIAKWHGEWEKECPPKDLLSSCGFIVEECVAGFLYSTDSKVCFLDCFISDPHVTKAERDEALDVLVAVLVDHAKGLENKVVIANSINGNIKSRALKHGFGFAGDHGVFYKEIR
jgi:hypothetical protein